MIPRRTTDEAAMRQDGIVSPRAAWWAFLLMGSFCLPFGCTSARPEGFKSIQELSATTRRPIGKSNRPSAKNQTSRIEFVSTNFVRNNQNEMVTLLTPGTVEPNNPVSGTQPLEAPLSGLLFPSTPPDVIFQCSEPRCLNLCDDLYQLPQRLKNDVGSLVTCDNALFLGTAAGVAATLRNNVDNRVIHDTDLHGPRWGHVSEGLSHGGDAFLVHIPLLAGMYATSLYQQNEDLHDLTLTMFTSYKFSLISAIALQYLTGTHRSNGGGIDYFRDNGFPSESTAASFALAAVVDERFGWKGGVPAYLVASLIGWSEIDQNHQTVSEVAFGAALGYVIGKSIGALYYRPNTPFHLVPLSDAFYGTQGMAIEFRY